MKRATADLTAIDDDTLRQLVRSRGFQLVKNFHRAATRRGYVNAKNFHRAAVQHGYMKKYDLDELMRHQRFAVDEVIDVGVNTGTEWLYDVFDAARHILVEPIPDGEQMLKWRPADYTFLSCGVGATNGELVLNRYNNEMLTSFLPLHNIAEQINTKRQLAEQVTVPVRTLDDIIEEHCSSDRIGIKIDTEGFELEAVRGLDRHRGRVVFIVAEASVRQRHVGSYQFSDLVAELQARDFCFLNVMNPLSRAPQFLDTLFVQREDPRLTAPVQRIDDLEERDAQARARVLARGAGRAQRDAD